MPKYKATGSVHPRFNLWYAESLIDGYELTGDTRYLEAATKTVCGSVIAFSGILWLRLREHGVSGFDDAIELSLDWILKKRYATGHPDPNLAGAVINTRLRYKKGKLWVTQRVVGTTFGVRFLASYYEYTFGNRKL